MSNNTREIVKPATRKEVKKAVYEKIAASLAEFKGELKEKKFSRNLKKASKIFASDIARTISKKNRKKKDGNQNKNPLAGPKS